MPENDANNQSLQNTSDRVEVASTDLEDQPEYVQPKTLFETLKGLVSSLIEGIKNLFKKDSMDFDTSYGSEKFNKNSVKKTSNPLYQTPQPAVDPDMKNQRAGSHEKLHKLPGENPTSTHDNTVEQSTADVESQRPESVTVPDELKGDIGPVLEELKDTLNKETSSSQETQGNPPPEQAGGHAQQVTEKRENQNPDQETQR